MEKRKEYDNCYMCQKDILANYKKNILIKNMNKINLFKNDLFIMLAQNLARMVN